MFIAVRKFMALQAISPYLLRKFGLVDFFESHFFEEFGPIGKRKNFFDPEFTSFPETFPDECFADPVHLICFSDGERAYFRKVFPQNPERAYAFYHSLIFIDNEISDPFI